MMDYYNKYNVIRGEKDTLPPYTPKFVWCNGDGEL